MTTCQCGRPVDGATLCNTCTAALVADLQAVPSLAGELDVTLARQARFGERNGGRSAEKPLPYDVRASEAGWVLRNTLVGWARLVAEEIARPAPPQRVTTMETGSTDHQDHPDPEDHQCPTSGPTSAGAPSPANGPNTAPPATKTSEPPQQATTTAPAPTTTDAAAEPQQKSAPAAGSKTNTVDGTNHSAPSAANNSPNSGLPADTLPAIATYLLRHIPRLRTHPAAGEAAEEIRGAVQQARDAVDRPNIDRRYLGPHTCGTDLYAKAGITSLTCPGCTSHVNVDDQRDHIRGQLHDHLGSPSYVATVVTGLGVPLSPSAVREWARRHYLEHRGDANKPLYRVGDVLHIAQASREERKRERERLRSA